MNRGKQLKLWILTVWVLLVSGLAWLIAFRPASAEAPEEYLKWATAKAARALFVQLVSHLAGHIAICALAS
jgi:hypothetical protein